MMLCYRGLCFCWVCSVLVWSLPFPAQKHNYLKIAVVVDLMLSLPACIISKPEITLKRVNTRPIPFLYLLPRLSETYIFVFYTLYIHACQGYTLYRGQICTWYCTL